MRTVSDRFRARLKEPTRWLTQAFWSNDGGTTWTEAAFVSGTVTCSALSQIRWTCTLTIEAPTGRTGVNAFTTRLKVMHGLAGEPLLAMGRYKVTRVSESDETVGRIEVSGASYEAYLIGARFETVRTFRALSASALVRQLITEVLPNAILYWQCDDMQLPRITEPRDRWGLIDGDRDAGSAARAVGARVFTGPNGEWFARPTPTLEDTPTWTAKRGEVLLTASRELSDDGVFNIMVVNGESTDDRAPFPPGIAKDLDPLSLTYVNRTADEGGFGPRPRFYTSQMFENTSQAQGAARAMLAPGLGLRQKIDHSTLHDPTKEPGDVGLVTSRLGTERVILDSVTYDLNGAPTTGETRTTATRLAGDLVSVVDVEGSE